MSVDCFHLFETAIGQCALLWRREALIGVVLPESDEARMRQAIARRNAGAVAAEPPAFVRAAAARIARLCAGEPAAFDEFTLDRSGIEAFANRVYDALLKTPFGRTTTYGEIAEALGDKSLSRAVGAALGANPFPIIIPCHRVTGAGGRMGGFSAPGGAATKRRLLEIEGALAAERLPLFGG